MHTSRTAEHKKGPQYADLSSSLRVFSQFGYGDLALDFFLDRVFS